MDGPACTKHCSVVIGIAKRPSVALGADQRGQGVDSSRGRTGLPQDKLTWPLRNEERERHGSLPRLFSPVLPTEGMSASESWLRSLEARSISRSQLEHSLERPHIPAPVLPAPGQPASPQPCNLGLLPNLQMLWKSSGVLPRSGLTNFTAWVTVRCLKMTDFVLLFPLFNYFGCHQGHI